MDEEDEDADAEIESLDRVGSWTAALLLLLLHGCLGDASRRWAVQRADERSLLSDPTAY